MYHIIYNIIYTLNTPLVSLTTSFWHQDSFAGASSPTFSSVSRARRHSWACWPGAPRWQKYLLDPTVRRWPLSLACHDSLSTAAGLVMDGQLSEGELHPQSEWSQTQRMPWLLSGLLPGKTMGPGKRLLLQQEVMRARARKQLVGCGEHHKGGWQWKHLERFHLLWLLRMWHMFSNIRNVQNVYFLEDAATCLPVSHSSVGGVLFNISIRSCPINTGSLSRLKGTPAQAWTRYKPRKTKEMGTSWLVCCSCLLSVQHLAVFTITSPRARSWQTDGQGDDQTTRPPVAKRTRHVENAARIVRKLTRRQARGRLSHQYGPVTVSVTTLTHGELIINAN